MVPVLVEQLELERVRDLVGRDPRLRLGLEAADDQPADLLLEVRVAVGVAQDRQVGMDALDLVGDDVEVLGGVQRHGDVDAGREGVGPLAGAVDDDLGLDVAVARCRTPTTDVVLGEDVEDPDVLDHPRAALPRPLGQRHGEVGRVGLAVAGQPDGADEVVGRHQRPALAGLLRREDLALQVERLGGRGGAAQLDHPVLGARDGDAAAALEPRAQPGLVLQPRVEVGRVLHEAGAALGRPQLADQAGRVPRRAARQLALLEEQDVGLAGLGQVVGDARADDAAADDDDARPCRQRVMRGPRPRRATPSKAGERKSSTAASYRSWPQPWKS